MPPNGGILVFGRDKMEVFIPTLGRPTRQETWKNLPPSVQERTKLLINADDDVAYGFYPRIVLPSDCRGIGKVRQWVVENAGPKVVMLDDDLRFAIRRNDDPTKFRDATSEQVATMFKSISAALDVYAHVSVSTREGGNRCIEDYVWDTRLLRVLAYRTDVLRNEDISFDRIPVMEDFDVTLQLLRKGYSNVAINWMVQDQLGSNLAGGCSTYRSPELQAAAAHGLKLLHPNFVTVVTKQTKTAWQGQERTDVKIQWKKARDSYKGTPTALDT
jgi:hypothetical protein